MELKSIYSEDIGVTSKEAIDFVWENAKNKIESIEKYKFLYVYYFCSSIVFSDAIMDGIDDYPFNNGIHCHFNGRGKFVDIDSDCNGCYQEHIDADGWIDDFHSLFSDIFPMLIAIRFRCCDLEMVDVTDPFSDDGEAYKYDDLKSISIKLK